MVTPGVVIFVVFSSSTVIDEKQIKPKLKHHSFMLALSARDNKLSELLTNLCVVSVWLCVQVCAIFE